MSKTILLFMPALFDLHNQVQHALHKLNFEVDYIEDYKGRFSPLDRKSKFKTSYYPINSCSLYGCAYDGEYDSPSIRY